jgi:hypothetical protein
VRTTLRASVVLPIVTLFLLVPKVIWPQLHLYHDVLTGARINAVGHPIRLVCLAIGAVLAVRTAQRFEAGNASRRAWYLVSLWLVLYFLGDATLGLYQLLLSSDYAPTPSIGDAFFILGCLALVAATVSSLRAFWSSGYPLGSGSAYLGLALVIAVGAAAVCVPLVLATLAKPEPLATRMTAAAYPILDGLMLIPTVLLLRMTYRFRGGSVWRVWALLAGSIIVMSVGDIVFAYDKERFETLVDITEIISYWMAGAGAAHGFLALA